MSQVLGPDHHIKLTAAVFCFDINNYRLIEFGKLLSPFFSCVWLVSSPKTWCPFDVDRGIEGLQISESERCNIHNINALFIHTGDIRRLPGDLGELNASHKFYFNTPGTPEASPSYLPICRSTNPFDLHAADAQEIAEYVAGRGGVPRCCRPKDTPDLLLSLAILCQGYLAVYAEHENGTWGPHEITEALKQMGWSAFANHPGNASYLDRLPDKKSTVSRPDWWSAAIGKSRRDVIAKIGSEWGVPRIEDCPLKSLVEAIYATGALRPGVVASAYSALVTKLQGKT